MANAANAENVNADMRPPDYRYAVQQIRGGIEKKKDKISSVNGEIADIWSKIEGKGVNKKAGKFFAMLDKCETDERMDIMRSVNGMCDAAGWPENAGDMVDAAEGKVVQMRVGKAAQADPDVDDGPSIDPGSVEPDVDTDDDDNDEDGDDEESDPDPAPQSKRPSAQEAMAAARARFANGGKVPAMTPEYYTGDDSDLADEPNFDR